jgi:hypothetical protein
MWKGAVCNRETGHPPPHRCSVAQEVRVDSGLSVDGTWIRTAVGRLEWSAKA